MPPFSVLAARAIVGAAFVCFASAAHAQVTYVPGTSYFGANSYIEYIPGNLPVIFTAAHGGALTPASIPARTSAACGEADFSTVRDLNTEELTRAIGAAFYARTGRYPHIIINRLHRNRLDANRPLDGGACGNAAAEHAWHEFHAFVETAKAAVAEEFGRGWYTDIHGHGHAIQRLELGYNMTGATLRRSDAELDADAAFEASTSFNIFSQQSARSFSALLRGQTALGTLFENAGIPAVPSAQDPAPAEGDAFFSGGYNTRAHGCRDGGTICGLQIEANLQGVRDTGGNRAAFAMKLVEVYDEFLSTNFDIWLPPPPPPDAPGRQIVVDNNNALNDAAVARFEASTNWSNANNSQAFGTNFRLASAANVTDDGAEFFFLVTTPGTYTIDAWWPAVSTRSSGASYRVFEVDGGTLLADLKRSQRANGAVWNALGTFTFAKTGWAKVLMSRSLAERDGSLAADAVRATLDDVPNRAPYARMIAPLTAPEGAAVSVDGSRSYDLDLQALSHRWTFPGGAAAQGATASRIFAQDGAYDVTLTVEDPLGATGSMLRTVVITNVPPSVDAFDGATLLPGETYTAAGTFSDPGADVWTGAVDYGDGGGEQALDISGRTFSLAHTYTMPGVYTVGVRVADEHASDTASTEVTVLAPAAALDDLAALLDAAIARGDVAHGNGRSLRAKLDAAARHIGRGTAGPSDQQLGAFEHELQALTRAGRVPAATAAAMEALAGRLRRSLAF